MRQKPRGTRETRVFTGFGAGLDQGLKIRRSERTVGVRFPLPAPEKSSIHANLRANRFASFDASRLPGLLDVPNFVPTVGNAAEKPRLIACYHRIRAVGSVCTGMRRELLLPVRPVTGDCIGATAWLVPVQRLT
jgi:hypothetical protein